MEFTKNYIKSLLSHTSIIEQDIVSETPLLHLALTLTRTLAPILDSESSLDGHKAAPDHTTEALRDPPLPAPEHPFHRAPAKVFTHTYVRGDIK